ncbi:MAG: class II glutamine amidotransferase [Variovorax sp.]
MCGIVGLMIKKPALRGHLGEWALPMLVGMTERGPDSAGIAVFTEPVAAGHKKLSACAPAGFEWDRVRRHFGDLPAPADDPAAPRQKGQAALEIDTKANHAVITTTLDPIRMRESLKHEFPELRVLSAGRQIDLYKDIGSPASIAERYGLQGFAGSHLVAHTRMATESSVTVENAHPYAAGEDWCLVHNGALSNPGGLRRKLMPLGIDFDGDCDTEGACRFLEWRMREGDSLEQALHKGFDELDGFYTFLMGTADAMAIVRDSFACKPALVAETDDWVAIASEYRSLAHLPGVEHAHLFEPDPEKIYVWRADA